MHIVVKTSYILIGMVVVVLIILALIFIKPTHSTAAVSMPYGVQYSLEYFNAVNTNSTILVPQRYYAYAEALAINNNLVVANDTLYNKILFGNATLPKNEYILIDMPELSYLSNGSIPGYPYLTKNLTAYPVNYTIENLTADERDCADFSQVNASMALCNFYLDGIDIGKITLLSFPGVSGTYIANSTVLYNGENYTYLPSRINPNSTDFLGGIDFIYDGNFNIYIPKAIMDTFYGREMFLPENMSGNVVSNIEDARIIKG